jgi:hypothetical protein
MNSVPSRRPSIGWLTLAANIGALQGLYDRVEFGRQKDAWKATFATSVGAISYWCEVRTLYSPRFMAEMDALLPKRC